MSNYDKWSRNNGRAVFVLIIIFLMICGGGLFIEGKQSAKAEDTIETTDLIETVSSTVRDASGRVVKRWRVKIWAKDEGNLMWMMEVKGADEADVMRKMSRNMPWVIIPGTGITYVLPLHRIDLIKIEKMGDIKNHPTALKKAYRSGVQFGGGRS